MSVRFKDDDTIIYGDRTSNSSDTAHESNDKRGFVSDDGMKEEKEDEKSVSEEESINDDEGSSEGAEEEEDEREDEVKDEEGNSSDEEKSTDGQKSDSLLQRISSSRSNNTASTRSVVEWDDSYENDVGFSQDPRSFISRMFWKETDVRFYNQTNREVMFIIADEEFTLKRVSKSSASASLNDDDDDDDDNIFKISDCFSGFMPISTKINKSQSQISAQSALKTRCMPLAPHSDSSQYFQEERLTYVTVLTKDIDGEDMPWSRVHYENKVINCKRTKSLKFFNKHLKVIAYRIAQQPQSSPPNTQIVSPMNTSINLRQITKGNRIRTRSTSKKRLCITEKQDSKRIKDGV